jgi:hypothetical protein
MSKNNESIRAGSRLVDLALVAVIVLCIYGAIDPSAASDLVQAIGKAVMP